LPERPPPVPNNPGPSLPTLSRRQFLLLGAASVALAVAGCHRDAKSPRVGLALGGGGAKGLAHILMLETLDQLGVTPHVIAGTSIGAIIGALYAAGLSGHQIHAQLDQFFVDRKESERKLFALPKSMRWLDFIDPQLNGDGLLNSDDFIAYLGEIMPAHRFRDLHIPLRVVTAEQLTGREVDIDSGELLPAIQASMAVPGVFPAVQLNGRTLVDGGVANPLPYDLLEADCDIVVAVDVSGDTDLKDGETLSMLGAVFQGFHAMSNNILAEKLKRLRPTVYVKPDIRNVQILEFYKAQQIFEQAEPARQRFAQDLQQALRKYAGRPGCTLLSPR